MEEANIAETKESQCVLTLYGNTAPITLNKSKPETA